MKKLFIILFLFSLTLAQQLEHPKPNQDWNPRGVTTPLLDFCTYNLCPSLPYPYACALSASTVNYWAVEDDFKAEGLWTQVAQIRDSATFLFSWLSGGKRKKD